MAATTRDLDAYEALPEQLRTSSSRAAARQLASDALPVEMEYLLRAADEPEVIRAAATDLERRAGWYGLDADIGPLLDRADDLAAAEDTGLEDTGLEDTGLEDTGPEDAGHAQPGPADGDPVDIAELCSHLTQ